VPARIVVTGASGFVGRSVVSKLRNSNKYDVVAVSRTNREGFHNVQEYSDSPKGDLLIHLGEESTLRKVDDDAVIRARKTITSLTEANRYRHVIYASSGVLYGENSEARHTTSDTIFRSNFYSELKINSEQAVMNSHSGVVVRLSNIIGPDMSTNSVVSKILHQLPTASDIRLESISPVRDFLWIDDAASCFTSLTHAMLDGIKTAPILNLSSGIGTSIESLAKTFLEFSKAPGRRVIGENETNTKSVIILDNSETLNQLNWHPNVSLREGVAVLCQIQSKIMK